MNISKDTRECLIRYVDEINLHSATTRDIVKLLNTDKEDTLQCVCKIIAAGKGLNEEEQNVLYMLYTTTVEIPTPRNIYEEYVEIFKRSYATFYRGITKLIKKHIIYIDDNNKVKFLPAYIFNDIEDKKFIVIEISKNNKYK